MFEDTNGWNQKLWIEVGQTAQWPKEKRRKGQTTNYKTLLRKQKILQSEPHLQPG